MNDTHYIFNICGVVALLNDLFLVEVWNILIFMRGIRLFLLIVKCWHNTNWFFLERCIFFLLFCTLLRVGITYISSLLKVSLT